MIQEKTKSLNALKAKENRTVEENRRIEFYESELSSLDSLKGELSGLKEAYTDMEKSYSDLRWKYYKTVVFSWLGRIGWLFVGLVFLVFYGVKFYLQIHG
ncbi:hypothetical protein [Leptospira yasudae]|uniref:hypothetical protein n=1 Tax=Leptospira yasudae TaxID=2202201 RepID=UPI001090C771|nr:hypothetical protein [Leptospira yasudae]TGM99687.1 hypothetical protein EHR10_08835 [Leptospira yasudae]